MRNQVESLLILLAVAPSLVSSINGGDGNKVKEEALTINRLTTQAAQESLEIDFSNIERPIALTVPGLLQIPIDGKALLQLKEATYNNYVLEVWKDPRSKSAMYITPRIYRNRALRRDEFLLKVNSFQQTDTGEIRQVSKNYEAVLDQKNETLSISRIVVIENIYPEGTPLEQLLTKEPESETSCVMWLQFEDSGYGQYEHLALYEKEATVNANISEGEVFEAFGDLSDLLVSCDQIFRSVADYASESSIWSELENAIATLNSEVISEGNQLG